MQDCCNKAVNIINIRIKLHYTLQEKLGDEPVNEIEVKEGVTAEELLKKIGIEDINSVMIAANGTIVPLKEVLRDIDEIKIYPVILGG